MGSDEMQAATVKTFRRLWGRVATTREVMAELGGGAARAAAGAGR